MRRNVYLDIETTGLSSYSNDVTVIGVHLDDGADDEVIQFIGDEIRSSKLIKVIKKADTLYTYNGTQFDLPFIRRRLGVDLTEYCLHKDLKYACWHRNLYGGLKVVEKKLGIKRKVTDVDGWMAVQLWHKYTMSGCEHSLEKLLAYNREDVLNLKKLRIKLKL